MTIGLMLELTRNIGFENARMKAGEPWQMHDRQDIEGKTLGVHRPRQARHPGVAGIGAGSSA